MKKFFISLFIPAFLAACGEKTPVQTVDWYKSNEVERKEMISKCKDNPGELSASANCLNAQQATNEKANSRRGWLKPKLPDSTK